MTIATPLQGIHSVVAGLFRPAQPGTPLRVGVEAEVIPVHMEDGTPVPPLPGPGGPGTLSVLEPLARHRGWRREETGTGVPRFVLPDGAVLSFEPGGQLEYASAACTNLGDLDQRIQDLFHLLAEAATPRGIGLLARGLDPRTPIANARLVLSGDRYPRQQRHYDRKGPEGRVMMLQSAALHLNVDLGTDPRAAWTAANRITPHLTALFANAPLRSGASTPHRSHRAALWRRLDPTRNAVFGTCSDPVRSYLDFALQAESFLLGSEEAAPRPFRAWLQDGATAGDFARHLTTLFPEVRPRGYLELRSVDALPARWCIVPAALVASVLHHPPTRTRVISELPEPDQVRLERAGRLGLADEVLAAEVAWLREYAVDAMTSMGPHFVPSTVVQRVEDFFCTFTDRGLDPGHASGEAAELATY